MQRKRENCRQTKKTITKETSITGTRRKISASKIKFKLGAGLFLITVLHKVKIFQGNTLRPVLLRKINLSER